MTDRALANALKRRDDIAAEINKKNQEIESLRKSLSAVERFIAEWHQYADDLIGTADIRPRTNPDTDHEDVSEAASFWDPAGGSRTSDSLPAKTRKNPHRPVVGYHAREIILERGKPLSRRDLMEALNERGIEIHGKNPEMVLSTMMWRMPQEFIRLAGHGYWLRDLPYPPANYEGGRPFAIESEAEQDVLAAEIFDPESVAEA